MYFYDISDYITTFRGGYTPWETSSIYYGFLGLGPWRGFIAGDLEDAMTTARATSDAYFKALNEYFLSSLATSWYSREPEDSPISRLYFNDYQDSRLNFEIERKKYHNSYHISIRYYENAVRLGYTGTYDDWIKNRISTTSYVKTGTTNYSFTRMIYPNGSVIETHPINYGTIEDIKLIDDKYDNFKSSLEDVIRVTKTLMVLREGDDFEGLEKTSTVNNSLCEIVEIQPYIDFRYLDFMDDLEYMPSGSDIDLLYYTATTCNFSSIDTLKPSVDGFDFSNTDQIFRDYRNEQIPKINNIIDGLYLGFKKFDFPLVDYNLPVQPIEHLSKYYSKSGNRRIRHTWWSRASAYTEWNTVNYPIHGIPLSTLLNGVSDVKYLSAVSTVSELPSTASKGDLICVGTPSSFEAYAWDPILNSWSIGLHNFIEDQILTQRRQQKNRSLLTKNELILSVKPFLWANEYVISDVVRNWMLSDVSGYTLNTIPELIATNGANLPPKYSITASTHTLSGFTATTIIY
jgi:hypothetical protein